MLQNTDISIDFDQRVANGVRAAREARGESQAALALRAGVARTTLIGIEAGRGAQSGSIARVLAALGLNLIIGEDQQSKLRATALVERKLARLQAEGKGRDRREAHVRLAARLLANEPGARDALKDARRMVCVWRVTGSCSPAYADAWEQVLAGSPTQVGRALISLDETWANALLQNTPFSNALVGTAEARAG
ncbi:MAG: helix-turn-helix domain-containing protein [Betaproteobacteria bacterium]|nr:helix-turn-helix domain-containing protein [Betaproteobacteria bacterium]